MAETRIDQLTGLRALLAEDEREPSSACPLCDPVGLEPVQPEHASPITALAVRAEPGSEAAAGPPASADSGLSSSADPLGQSSRGTDAGLFTSQPAHGAIELIAGGSEHGTTLAGLGRERVGALCEAWQARIAAHAQTSSYVSLSHEEGPGLHGHATLRSLDFVPAEVARERERSAAYHERTLGGHLLGDVVTAEIRRRERFVAVDDEAVLLCPWASRSGYELRIVPRAVAPRYELGPSAAGMLATAAELLAAALGPEAGLLAWVRNAPRDTEEFCWHIDLMPASGARGGFGVATGVEVSSVAPERAAAQLRELHAERRRGEGAG